MLVLTAGCGSAGTPPADAPAPAPVVEAPVGEHYLIHYVDHTGIRRRDTRTRTDTVILATPGEVMLSRRSGDGTKVAVALARSDSTVLVMVDLADGSLSQVHAVPGEATYTFDWSVGGEKLGVGYRVESGSEPGRSGVLLIDAAGDIHDVGCSVSDRFVAWVPNDRLAVGDGANFYIVDARGCRTLATIPLRGRRDVTYSPDGRRIFLRRGPQDQFSRQRAGRRLELYVADYNGANPKRVTDYRFEARNARWSPDSRKIAFELKSQQFANLWHVAVYDLARDQATFDAKQRTLGQPLDSDPYWSPSGAKLVHDRSYARQGAGQSYSTNQKIVKVLPPGGTLSNSAETVVGEELSQEDGVTGEPIGRTLRWIDDTHIAFASPRWTRITNIEGNHTYDLPAGARLLSVEVFGAGQ